MLLYAYIVFRADGQFVMNMSVKIQVSQWITLRRDITKFAFFTATIGIQCSKILVEQKETLDQMSAFRNLMDSNILKMVMTVIQLQPLRFMPLQAVTPQLQELANQIFSTTKNT